MNKTTILAVALYLCEICLVLQAKTLFERKALWRMTGTKKHTNKQEKFTIVWPYIVSDSLWIKPTDALNSSFIGITTLHVSGNLSAHHQEFLAVHRLWYILCSCDDRLLPGVGWNYQSRCAAKNSWWWAERLPETCRIIKLECSASVGFIYKENVQHQR